MVNFVVMFNPGEGMFFLYFSHVVWLGDKKTHSGLQITGTVPPQISTHQMIKQKHQEKMLVFKVLKYLDTNIKPNVSSLFTDFIFSLKLAIRAE